MANPLDTDAGSELFSSYEAEFKLVQADLTQKLDQIPELSGEPRKAAISQAERALEEADELVWDYPMPERIYMLTKDDSSDRCASKRPTSHRRPGPR